MNDYFRGLRDGLIIILLIVGAYLCKVNFQYNESHYASLKEQIDLLKDKK